MKRASIMSFKLGAMLLFIGNSGSIVRGEVDLEWRPGKVQTVVGQSVQLEVFAVIVPGSETICSGSIANAGPCSSDLDCPAGTTCGQPMSAIDLVVHFDPSGLQLVDVVDTGPYQWLLAMFPDDADGWNNTWTDGSAYFTLWSNLSEFPIATTQGLHIATFEFQVREPSPSSKIDFVERSPLFFSFTEVFDGFGAISILENTGIAEVVTPTTPMFITDHAAFPDCMAGPGVAPAPEFMSVDECLIAYDLNLDGDVDGTDWRWLQVLFQSGE